MFSLREDHLAGLDPYRRWIPRRLAKAFRLEFLSPQAARETIRRTAHHGGVDFAEDAADRLVTDLSRVRVQQPDGSVSEELGQEVEPVQLQVVCRRLWNHLPAEDDRIGLDLVERYGEVGEALGEFYAESVAQVAETTGVSERDIRVWFDEHLITKRGIRGQVLQEPGQSAGLEDEAISELIDMHVVRAETRRGAVWFELAHDRLIEPIQANNDAWYQVNLNAFQQQARLWHSQGRAPGYLLADEALTQAEQWAADDPDGLTLIEREYLAACKEHRRAQDAERRLRDLESAQQLAQETQARQRAGGTPPIGSGAAGRWTGGDTETEAKVSYSSRVRGSGANLAHRHPSLLYASEHPVTRSRISAARRESVRRERATPEVAPGSGGTEIRQHYRGEASLVTKAIGGTVGTVWLKDSPIGALAFSPDGAHLLAGDQSGGVAIWLVSQAEPWQKPL